jgi:hypothetical protein
VQVIYYSYSIVLITVVVIYDSNNYFICRCGVAFYGDSEDTAALCHAPILTEAGGVITTTIRRCLSNNTTGPGILQDVDLIIFVVWSPQDHPKGTIYCWYETYHLIIP